MAEAEMIYHYCSLEAFLRIIESKSILLTNLRFMNDTQEHLWLRGIAVEVIDQMKRESAGFDQEFAECLKAELGNDDEFVDIYCACFSKERDLLSQWRAYAADGGGIAVGFRVDHFHEMLEQLTQLDDPKHCPALEVVVYERGEQERIVRDILSLKRQEAGNVLRLGCVASVRAKSPKLRQAGARWIQRDWIWRAAARCKNPAFREEGEMRIIYWPDATAKAKRALSGPEYRVGRNTIVPYYSLPILTDTLHPLARIVFGPKCDRRLTEPVARKLLEQTGFDTKRVEFAASSASYQSR